MSTDDIAENDESLSPGAYVNNNMDQEDVKVTCCSGTERHDTSANEVQIDDCSSCGVYLECNHCNLLSNQSKNNYLNQYNQQQAQQPTSTQSSSRKKPSPKYQILVEQSICLENLMNLLRDIGMAFFNLKQYECEKALGYFELLPQSQIQSSFVLSNMARANFELHNYLKAEKIYVQLRREYPYHLEGIYK